MDDRELDRLIEEKEEILAEIEREQEKQQEKQDKKQHKKGRAGFGLLMFLVGFVVAAALFIGCCFATGRWLTNDEYSHFKEYEDSFVKYYDLMKFIDKKAIKEYKGVNLDDVFYKEIIASLGDKYAEYFSASEFNSFENKFKKSYIGVGIGVVDYNGRTYVGSVSSGGPAEKAGVKFGDIITAVDGKAVNNATETCEKLEGKINTVVKLTVEREGETLEFTMKRAKIQEKSVSYRKLDKENKIGYVKISTFKEGTAREVKNAVEKLKKDEYKKIVIDLRSNGGGLTNEAYDVADYLLPKCKIVTVVDKNGKKKVEKSDSKNAGIKYVVLVDSMTASASEIVTAAIQDNKGGTIIGTTTYGKGVTQMTQTFADGSAVKVTIEEYLRPSGKKVDGIGITPDIVVDDVQNDDVIYGIAIQELLK